MSKLIKGGASPCNHARNRYFSNLLDARNIKYRHLLNELTVKGTIHFVFGNRIFTVVINYFGICSHTSQNNLSCIGLQAGSIVRRVMECYNSDFSRHAQTYFLSNFL